MTILAGQKITADQLDRMQPTSYIAACSSALSVTTTTYADIVGCSITLATKGANATYVVTGIFDCSVTTTSATSLMVARLLVDGVVDSGIAVYAMDTQDRACISMVWQGTLAAAGNHTLKLQGALTAAAGAGSFLQSDTKIQIVITEVV